MSAENSKFIPSSELQKDMFCIHLDEKSGDSLPWKQDFISQSRRGSLEKNIFQDK